MSFIQRPEINNIYYNFLDKDVCNNAIKYVEDTKEKMTDNPYACKCITSDSLSFNILNDLKLQGLHLNILAHVQNYMSMSGKYYEGFIEKSWFNIYHKEFFQEYHVHMDPVHRALCGIVYLTDSPDAVTQFYFHDTISVQPEFGKIVLFPDTVEHRVSANESENQRITLAFNYRKCNEWKGMYI
tara:strand:+ start:3186 stop:3737 length:552 start_codon:yes stop_codon:yes gene_type:complete